MINLIGPTAGTVRSHAANSWMNSAAALVSMTGNVANMSPTQLLYAEKNLRLGMMNDSFNYKAYSLMGETADKIQKENIKRSFSTFA